MGYFYEGGGYCETHHNPNSRPLGFSYRKLKAAMQAYRTQSQEIGARVRIVDSAGLAAVVHVGDFARIKGTLGKLYQLCITTSMCEITQWAVASDFTLV